MGLFEGTLLADELIEDEVYQSGDFFGGLWVGWDFDHYWGTEVRLGWAELSITGTPTTPISAIGDVFFADWVFLYYPWGDSRVRPYFLVGLGTGRFDYSPNSGGELENSLLAVPVGAPDESVTGTPIRGGRQYQFRPWPVQYDAQRVAQPLARMATRRLAPVQLPLAS